MALARQLSSLKPAAFNRTGSLALQNLTFPLIADVNRLAAEVIYVVDFFFELLDVTKHFFDNIADHTLLFSHKCVLSRSSSREFPS